MWQLDLVFGSRRRVKKVRIFRAWFSQLGGAAAMLDDVMRVQWEVEVYCARVTCGLCLATGPAVEERPEDDQEDVGQEGGQKGGRVGEFFFSPSQSPIGAGAPIW